MNKEKSGYGKLYGYISREYILAFIVSFAFFFFIFFVNQILVIAQKILIKNVGFLTMLRLVALAIPQFLMYTMPFSSLASASMVIGNFSSDNEIMAMRSCGIHTGRIFIPILAVSLLLSLSTLWIADTLIPFTASRYRELYSEMLSSLPTLELKPYSSTKFGNRVIANGAVKGGVVFDITIFDDSDPSSRKVITAESATVSLIDLDTLTYKIQLENASILMTNSNSLKSYNTAKAENLELYLKLSSSDSISTMSESPSQMSIRSLVAQIQSRKSENDHIIEQHQTSLNSAGFELGRSLEDFEKDSLRTGISNVCDSADRVLRLQENGAFSFYYQYYRSELYKKLALSFACTCLVFVAFPISFFKVKNGRLVGFGLSMLVACFYWFFLYYMHTRALVNPLNPGIFLWMPNFTVLAIGMILLFRMRKA